MVVKHRFQKHNQARTREIEVRPLCGFEKVEFRQSTRTVHILTKVNGWTAVGSVSEFAPARS
jgi:hypothetical protein